MSRITLSFIAAVLLVVATAGVALAKCPEGSTEEQCQGVVGTLDMSGTLSAGTSTEVAFWVHDGGAPVRAISVELIFARVGDGTVLRFEAEPNGPEGRYATDVELPAGGSWVITAEVRGLDGAMFSLPLETLQVANLPGAPSDGTSPVPTAPVTIPTWGWAALAGALLAGVIGTALIGRRRTATTF